MSLSPSMALSTRQWPLPQRLSACRTRLSAHVSVKDRISPRRNTPTGAIPSPTRERSTPVSRHSPVQPASTRAHGCTASGTISRLTLHGAKAAGSRKPWLNLSKPMSLRRSLTTPRQSARLSPPCRRSPTVTLMRVTAGASKTALVSLTAGNTAASTQWR